MFALLLTKLGPKFWIGLFIVAAFAVMGITCEVYRSKWQTAQAAVVQKQVELDTTLKDLKVLSDQTELLKKSTDEKTAIVAKAQDQAATLAKGNQALANKILQTTASVSDQCVAAAQLYKDYKAQAGK